jgi:chaperonin GroEL
MAKKIHFDDEARQGIKKGADILAKAVSTTLGPRGKAVVIEKSYGAPQVTFDGVTVAKEIELEDKFENLGSELLKQAADKTNDVVGDGTTTAIVLAHAMIEAGEKALKEKGVNVIQLAEELRSGADEIIKRLESQKEDINDAKKIGEVASLSAKNKEIGRLIADVMNKVGRDGVVTIDDSNTIKSEFEVVEGMQFDKGYISPYMMTNSERMEASLENPHILVTDKKISSIDELLPLLEKIVASGKKDMVIIADDVDGQALATLVVNKLRGTFNILAVKAPGFGDRKKEVLEDIAIVTGATLISEDVGRKLEAVDVEDLGSARRVVSTKDHTTIVDGKGEKKSINERVSQIRSQISQSDSDFDKEKLQERLGKLSGGVAVIKVGAPTESAQKELKQRVEDAVAATRAAMEEGIVPGGGMALFHAGSALRERSGTANEILVVASEMPLRAIILNSGKNAEEIVKNLSHENPWRGFDANTQQIADLKSAGIVDPLKVTKTAFLNAVSVASNYLEIGAAVTDIPEENPSAGSGRGMGGGMPGMM